ncbi:ring finger-like protein, partial [Lasius niger]
QPARALHVMCSEGDVAGIVELLRHVHDQVSDVRALVRYQDPLAEMKSGLHLAVENGHEDIVWLLLWLSSTLPTEAFPLPGRQAVESLGLGRLSLQPDDDIRGLLDGRGRTAEGIAQQDPGPCSYLRGNIRPCKAGMKAAGLAEHSRFEAWQGSGTEGKVVISCSSRGTAY